MSREKSHRSRSRKAIGKLYPFVFGNNNFGRAGNSLNIPMIIKTLSFPYPTHLNPRFPDKVDTNKINLHTGRIGTGKKKWTQPRFQINLFTFLLQKDTRFCSHTKNRNQQAQTTKSWPTILSFTFLQPAHGSNINFAWLQVHPTV